MLISNFSTKTHTYVDDDTSSRIKNGINGYFICESYY